MAVSKRKKEALKAAKAKAKKAKEQAAYEAQALTLLVATVAGMSIYFIEWGYNYNWHYSYAIAVIPHKLRKELGIKEKKVKFKIREDYDCYYKERLYCKYCQLTDLLAVTHGISFPRYPDKSWFRKEPEFITF